MSDNQALAGTLIALDVDGTLLGHGGALSERTVTAIAAASNAGAVLTLATGRDWSMVTWLLEANPALSHALCVNGIEVFHRDGVELWAASLDHRAATTAVRSMREAIPGLAVGAGIGGDFIGEQGIVDLMPDGVGEVRLVEDIQDHLGPGLRDLVLAHHDHVHDVDGLHGKVSHAVGHMSELDVAYTGLPMIEIVPPGAGKHQGLAWLAQYLGIEQRNVVAFGDGQNDLSMLAWAGLGVAMGQAPENVRNVADEVTDHVDADGVAQWIEARLP